MALAWAQAKAQEDGFSCPAATSALLGAAVNGGAQDAASLLLMGGSAAASGGATASAASGAPKAKAKAAAAPPVEALDGHIVVLTQVLPDGLGDLIFGENAVHELQELGPIAWIRCYTSEDNSAAGERLVADTAKSVAFSWMCSNREGLYAAVGAGRLERLWLGSRERFLAPWIFGLSTHEEALLQLAHRSNKPFWAMTEYGRGMGNIHTYTGGLGAMLPTGWTLQGEPGGVFRSILKAPRTETQWRRTFADHCGVADSGKVRLWWFYSRKDDEKKHDFRELDRALASSDVPAHVRAVAKVIPVGADGQIVTDAKEKTSGEKLAEQLFQAANDPNFKPNPNVACAEAAAGSAAQLSQFLWGVLFDHGYVEESRAGEGVDIIVAPNVLTKWREASGTGVAVAQVVQLDLVRGGSVREVPLPENRRVFIVSSRVPRAEMRTFLEQCEERVYTTGDQSLAEAMFMGKIPCVKPDAKVQQWQLALMARLMGSLDAVPDLGADLRRLVQDPAAREAARRQSKQRSDELERGMVAQLGGPPDTWTPTQQVLARAGMLG